MIRGVSRFSVEIKATGSPYFESAICFVRPQYARTERMDLHRAALELMERLNSEVEPALEENGAQATAEKPSAVQRLRAILPLVVSGLTGAAAAFLFCLLI